VASSEVEKIVRPCRVQLAETIRPPIWSRSKGWGERACYAGVNRDTLNHLPGGDAVE